MSLFTIHSLDEDGKCEREVEVTVDLGYDLSAEPDAGRRADEIARYARQVERRPLVELAALVEENDPRHSQAVVRILRDKIEALTRAAAYINDRTINAYGTNKMRPHDLAVRAQNESAYRVRKALDYTFPRNNIDF